MKGRGLFHPRLLVGAESGLNIAQGDDGLIAYPAIIRIVAAERSVKIDKKKVRLLRPSRLVQLLKASQSKKPSSSEQFLELLFKAHRLINRDEREHTIIPLRTIYEVLTVRRMPLNEYTETDFSRDTYHLARSGLARTKNGTTFELIPPQLIPLIRPGSAVQTNGTTSFLLFVPLRVELTGACVAPVSHTPLISIVLIFTNPSRRS